MTETGSLLQSLECRACCTEVDPHRPAGVCPTCGHALLAVYALSKLDARSWKAGLSSRTPSLWRYRELLPIQRQESIVTLGEGFTPVLPLSDVPEAPGVRVVLKDDGLLPTGSFKARGMSVAVGRARELGLHQLFVPSAGNAGVALAAYGARAGVRVRVYLPTKTSESIREACRAYGAEVVGVAGTIREAGAAARTAEKTLPSFDMSTLREPYRVEGKKTMGFEIFEQSPGAELPDAIVYPTGGGTGLVGMYKAFTELRELGLLERIPRLYAIQAEGCAPVVRALRDGAAAVRPWEDPTTVAPGLLVPAPFASERVLEAVRGSGGSGDTVSDSSLLDAMDRLAQRHGISASPEGAAPYAALESLTRHRLLRPGETVLLYNTGSGLGFSSARLRDALPRDESRRHLETPG
ncbi:MAG: threonine synthase [Thermoplasmata archaeon]|nr:threonine synthase [Thermoplasmata archaeon]